MLLPCASAPAGAALRPCLASSTLDENGAEAAFAELLLLFDLEPDLGASAHTFGCPDPLALLCEQNLQIASLRLFLPEALLESLLSSSTADDPEDRVTTVLFCRCSCSLEHAQALEQELAKH